jgi:hypothetical protein
MVNAGRESDLPCYPKSRPLYWDADFLQSLREIGLKSDIDILNAAVDLRDRKIDLQRVADIFKKNGRKRIKL